MRKSVTVFTVLVSIFLGVVSVAALELGTQITSPNAFPYWAITYGDARANHLADIALTSDGGYVASVWIEDSTNSDADVWVMKFDATGAVTWQTNFESNFLYASLSSILPTRDGGYIAAGTTGAIAPDSGDGWIVKLNSDGTVAWQKQYGGSLTDKFYSIIETVDNEYLVVGETYSYGSGSTDFWVLKLNTDGSIEWERTYGGSDSEGGLRAARAGTDGFVVAGYTYSFGAGSSDFWILKLNRDGTIVWQKTYGGISYDHVSTLLEVEDGHLVGGSYRYGFGNEPGWLLKLNVDGSIAWQKAYGGSAEAADESISSVVETSAGDYLVSGYTDSFGAGNVDVWLAKLDPTGEILWEKTYGGTDGEYGREVNLIGNQILLAGKTRSYGAGNFDLWLLKLDDNGGIDNCDVIGTSTMMITTTQVIPADTDVLSPVSTTTPADVVDVIDNTIFAGQQMCYVEIPTIDIFLPLILK